MGRIAASALIGTLFKINWLVAFFTGMFTVELIGKNFDFFTAILAFAGE
jgi:hypothetical protein